MICCGKCKVSLFGIAMKASNGELVLYEASSNIVLVMDYELKLHEASSNVVNRNMK